MSLFEFKQKKKKNKIFSKQFVTTELTKYGLKFSVLSIIISKKSKVGDLSRGDPKAPFPIATTLRFRGGRYSFPWIAPLYTWYVPYIAEC